MGKGKYPDLCDEYGELDRRIKELERRKDEIRKSIIESGYKIIEGKKFTIKVSVSPQYVYDNNKLYALLKKEKFIECVKPVATKLKEYISPHEIQSCIVSTIEIHKITVKENKA